MRSCLSCGEENSDRARFCQNCATPLALAAAPSAEVRKVVTIVFADVTGSTALGERLDPESLRRVMNRYFDEMESVIRSHGGAVEKFIGDAVMAVFGIPRLHEDDAVRAVRAAAAMRGGLDVLNAELERIYGVGILVRIGVNTGEVVAGDPSSGQRLVTGDAVNVAARLEQAASPGEVLLGESTYRLVRDAVEVQSVDPLELKGKAERVPAFRLVAVRADVAGHERHLDLPLVGRVRELEILDRAFERARTECTCQLLTLLGPAGVGKSRMVQEFLAARASSATVLRGRCPSYGEGIAYFPLAEVVREAAGIAKGDPASTAREKLSTLVADAQNGERIASLVGGLFGWDEAGPTEDVFWAIRKLFEQVARSGPLVVEFDDIHWADPTFLDLIEHLADWMRNASVLLLCVARPELLEVRSSWGGGRANATSIMLEPLAARDASMLVDKLLGPAAIPSAVRHRILETAEGNPLFVEEMLGMLIDDGQLWFEEGEWRAAEDVADLAVPPTIHLLLAARLERLDAEERKVIERGAIEGEIFHTGAVAALSLERSRPHVPSRLLALASKELIRSTRAEFAGEDAFRFRHLLIRDAAYQAMPKELRADLHERFAGWVERAAGERVEEFEEILAYHLEQAHRYWIDLRRPDSHTKAIGNAAAIRLIRSADRASGDRGDSSSARALLHRAAEVSDGDLRARALFKLSRALFDLYDFQTSVETAEAAITTAEEYGDRVVALRARLIYVEGLGQIDPSRTLKWTWSESKALLAELERVGDAAGIRQAKLAIARTSFYLGNSEACLAISEELRGDAEALPFIDRREIITNVSVACYFGPTPAEAALRMVDQVHDLVPGSLVTQAIRFTTRTGLLAMRGLAEESRAASIRADELWAEVGAPGMRLAMRQPVGEAERYLGRSDVAEATFREMAEEYTTSGETGFNSTISGLLALSLCDQAKFDEAEVHAARSRSLAAEDDVASQAASRMAQAQVLLERGHVGAALALADEAVAIMAATDYLDWQGEAHEIRGTVLLAAGRVPEAREAIAEAVVRYERKGIVPWAERAHFRLEALGA
jgi:class 3 adenylate cyclase/predicted negative regulator of RcsB-dependent stress response